MAKRTDHPAPREREPGKPEKNRNDTDLASSPQPKISHPYAKTPNILMTLPPEIRNIIYESVLAYPSGRYFIGRSARSSEPPFLQAASPEMRKEAAPIFYHSHKFRMDLSVDGDEMAITVETLRDIIGLCGSNPFTSFNFWIQARQHGKLSGLLPLLELIRATGLVLRTNDRLMDCLWVPDHHVKTLRLL